MKKTILLLMLIVSTFSFGQYYDVQPDAAGTSIAVREVTGTLNDYTVSDNPTWYSVVDDAFTAPLAPEQGGIINNYNGDGVWYRDHGGRIRFGRGIEANIFDILDEDSPRVYIRRLENPRNENSTHEYLFLNNSGTPSSATETYDVALRTAIFNHLFRNGEFDLPPGSFDSLAERYFTFDINGNGVYILPSDAGDGMTRWEVHQPGNNGALRDGFNGISHYNTIPRASTQQIDRHVELRVESNRGSAVVTIPAGTNVDYLEYYQGGYHFSFTLPTEGFGELAGDFERIGTYTAAVWVTGHEVSPAPPRAAPLPAPMRHVGGFAGRGGGPTISLHVFSGGQAPGEVLLQIRVHNVNINTEPSTYADLLDMFHTNVPQRTCGVFSSSSCRTGRANEQEFHTAFELRLSNGRQGDTVLDDVSLSVPAGTALGYSNIIPAGFEGAGHGYWFQFVVPHTQIGNWNNRQGVNQFSADFWTIY